MYSVYSFKLLKYGTITVNYIDADGNRNKKECVGGNTKREAEESYKREFRKMDRFGRI